MAETKLKTQAMDATTRLASKIISFSRDISAANGNVAYTGVGFVPTSLIILGVVAGGDSTSIGMSDSARNVAQMVQYQANVFTASAKFLSIAITAIDFEDAAVASYDADGFTLTWAKTGSPTGTATCYVLCLR